MTTRPNRIVLVYKSDSGLRALLADVVKKALGVNDCALCDLTHSPLGKRPAWKRCEGQLGVPVDALHRDELPADWGIRPAALPCVLAQHGSDRPSVLLNHAQIAAVGGGVEAFEAALRQALGLASASSGAAPDRAGSPAPGAGGS